MIATDFCSVYTEVTTFFRFGRVYFGAEDHIGNFIVSTLICRFSFACCFMSLLHVHVSHGESMNFCINILSFTVF